jgi:hypothetical protein
MFKTPMFKRSAPLCFAIAIVSFVFHPASFAEAAEWGSLKGRFVVDGDAPDPPKLVVDKDPFCMQAKPTSDALVVADDGALANAVVYLRLERRAKIDTHPDYAAKLSEPVALDNHGCMFEPHITLIRVGQPLLIKNSDPTGHNTNIAFLAFNQTIPAGAETQIKVGKEGPLPTPVVCNIHPWMKGYVLAQPHPYMAASAEDGTFEITNMPAGKHEFQLWHESPGYLRDLKLQGGATDRRGRVTLAIPAGETLDLGDIKVPASILK